MNNANIKNLGIELEEIFSTKQRNAILNEIIYSEEEIRISELSRRIKLSKGLISKYFNILERQGILKRQKNNFTIINNAYVKSIRIIFNILNIPQIFNKYNFVKAVGLYGSCTKGNNTKSSDVDLWIKVGKVNDEKIAVLTKELRDKVKNLSLLLINDEKLKEIKKEEIFYNSLVFGSIVLYGEENEIH